MKKRFLSRVVALATTLALCLPTMPEIIYAQADARFTFAITGDQKSYEATIASGNNDTVFENLPKEYEGKPTAYTNTFNRKSTITKITIPNTDIQNPTYNFVQDTALQNLKIEYEGAMTLGGTFSANTNITLYCSSLTLRTGLYFKAEDSCVWNVVNEQVKQTIQEKIPAATVNIVENPNAKKEGELVITSDIVKQAYGEKKIKIYASKNTNTPNQPEYSFYIDESCTIPPTISQKIDSDGYVSTVLPGTYYVKATVASTDEYKMAESEAIQIIIEGLDKTNLNEWSKKAQEILNQKAENYEDVSALKSAYDEITYSGILAGDAPAYTQSQVEEACRKLQGAIEGLKLLDFTKDKETLQETFSFVKENYVKDDYVAEGEENLSWSAFENALSEAEALLERDDAVKTDYQDALQAIEDAIKSLKPLDTYTVRNEWNAAVNEIKHNLREEDYYTEESYKAYTDVIAAYETIISDGTATVSKIKSLIEQLNSAAKALKEYDVTADKAELDALRKKAEGLKVNDYTAESYKAVRDALAEVSILSEDATKTPIREAIEKLNAAINGLVKMPITGGTVGNTDGNGITQPPNVVKPPAVSKVKKLKAKAQKGKKIKLTWKKVTGATGYKIRISTNKKFKKAKIITVKKASYIIKKFNGKKLKKGKKYYISVQAYAKYQAGNATKTAYGKIVKLKKAVKVK